jgi:hypothetical protein
LPFRADDRYVDPALGGGIATSLPLPSDPGAHLRFSAIGENTEISIDGGATEEPARLQNPAE